MATIVEGGGEVSALPTLLRRLNQWRTPEHYARVLPPIRVRRDRFLHKDEEFRRRLLLAAAKCGEAGWVLVLLDADDDCPAELGPETLRRAQSLLPHRAVSVVLANREFEAWFIAAAPSLDGKRGFSFERSEAVDAESPRDAKGWLAARMAGNSYRPKTDQPAFAALMDLQQAHDGSRSFRKLCDEWSRQTDLLAASRQSPAEPPRETP
ncbi:DUF4276 family protein [Endothiovibrio diazotrophicus]